MSCEETVTTLPDSSALATKADLERLRSELKAEFQAANRREDCGLSPALRTELAQLKADIIISQSQTSTIVVAGLGVLLLLLIVIR